MINIETWSDGHQAVTIFSPDLTGFGDEVESIVGEAVGEDILTEIRQGPISNVETVEGGATHEEELIGAASFPTGKANSLEPKTFFESEETAIVGIDDEVTSLVLYEEGEEDEASFAKPGPLEIVSTCLIETAIGESKDLMGFATGGAHEDETGFAHRLLDEDEPVRAVGMGEDFLRSFSVGEWSEGVGLTREDDVPEFARDATFDHDSLFPGEVAWSGDT